MTPAPTVTRPGSATAVTSFADLWDFVAFAEAEHPELDLLTPPKRPEKR